LPANSLGYTQIAIKGRQEHERVAVLLALLADVRRNRTAVDNCGNASPDPLQRSH
jgi:hypothetical protein